MSQPLPTYAQLLELPAQIIRRVPPEFIDGNGHMNIGRYLELGGTALWGRCQEEFGMPSTYITDRGLSTFTAEHHLAYHFELLEGEQVSVHTRLIACSDKVLHAVSLIVNRTRQRLACTVEATIVHIDMTSRRPAPFPDDVAALLDAALRSDDVGWPAPLCGTMGVRRGS